MYNQFCKNLNYYMSIVSDPEGNSARKHIAEIVLPLADIKSYLYSKQTLYITKRSLTLFIRFPNSPKCIPQLISSYGNYGHMVLISKHFKNQKSKLII